MADKNKPAFPLRNAVGYASRGISERTYVATKILSGLAANEKSSFTSEEALVNEAVRLTDLLITKLEE